MEKIIESAVVILKSKYDLPSKGFLAGGSLANTIFTIVTGKSAPINDIDIYRIIDIGDHKFSDFKNKQSFQKMELSLDEYRGIYHQYKQGDYCIIENSSHDGITNYIDYKTNTSNYQIIIDSFDINCCQVGYDLESNMCFYTKNFQEFLNTQELRLVNLTSPSHSAIRLVKKKLELDVKLPEIELDAIRYVLTDVTSKRFIDLKKRRFQERYRDLYYKYQEELSPYFSITEDDIINRIYKSRFFYLKPIKPFYVAKSSFIELSTDFLYWIRNIYQNKELEKKCEKLNLIFDIDKINDYLDIDITDDKLDFIERICSYAPKSLKNLRGLVLSKQLKWIDTLFDKYQHDPIIAISILEKIKYEEYIDLEDDMARLLLELSVRKDIIEDNEFKVSRILDYEFKISYDI